MSHTVPPRLPVGSGQLGDARVARPDDGEDFGERRAWRLRFRNETAAFAMQHDRKIKACMTENFHVSVVIPTYRRPEKTHLAVQTVIEQSLAPIEIIVVDDHSPEGEFAQLVSLVGHQATIVRADHNGGPGAAPQLWRGGRDRRMDRVSR